MAGSLYLESPTGAAWSTFTLLTVLKLLLLLLMLLLLLLLLLPWYSRRRQNWCAVLYLAISGASQILALPNANSAWGAALGATVGKARSSWEKQISESSLTS